MRRKGAIYLKHYRYKNESQIVTSITLKLKETKSPDDKKYHGKQTSFTEAFETVHSIVTQAAFNTSNNTSTFHERW